ncbi:V/A-type H+-transporting ATPase subunit E [Deinococcus metalli]|uniref:V-type ATP synthase subunit E n=1 Tax=Deinococcus metalli TaxID=1141878 RepID=A0A7W8NRJ7_9DEIO|nr:V-type ATP synthase subunit E [Deinococcus metalli]MBB5377960.1 V/A-type H+-transporting ATPase subunit E [Deinococcus metalli]GHF54841.1 v-type ATP synthase subunit E [Deinococcus metalli]
MSLGDILETEIQGEIARIREDAQARADQIVAQAQERARNMIESRQRAQQADYAAGLTRARSAADLDANAQRLSAGDSLQVQAFQTAEQYLQGATTAPEYPQVLAKLIAEGLAALPDAEVVEAASAEHGAVHQALAQLGRHLEVRANESVKTGVRLVAGGGKTSVQNTLLGRLNASRAELSAQVSRLLADA